MHGSSRSVAGVGLANDGEARTFGEKCPVCNQDVWTTDEYDDMDDPITFCDPQCPHDGETLNQREE